MKNSGKRQFTALGFKCAVFSLIMILALSTVLVPTNAAIFSVTLESPANNITTMNNEPDFRFTATHPSKTTLTCTLWLKLTPSGNPTAHGTNSNVANGTSTVINTSSPISNGQYQWWINCSDGASTIISEKRTITINVIRGTLSFTASLDGSNRHYWLDEPDHFDGVTPTPLVIFLHGYGQDNTCYNTYYPGLEQVFRGNGWMVACPECRHVGATSYHDWYSAPSRSDITDVINLLEAQFNIDRSHIDTIGTSMGGGGALQPKRSRQRL
jgi:dipeptidyl aminopeptidase/acylaminoacyl peptidase